MFGLQPWHLIVILAVALLVFGPSRLPEIGQAVGKSIREFRDAATTAQDSIRDGLVTDKPAPKSPTESAEYAPLSPAKTDKTDAPPRA